MRMRVRVFASWEYGISCVKRSQVRVNSDENIGAGLHAFDVPRSEVVNGS